jgi:ubiquitin C-terminal hydrolase
MAQRRKDPSDKSPIGLKNVGNTCYFNSLLQTIFMLPNLTRKILV